MKRLILLILSICIAEFSFSQTDFRKGYVITNARDTLVGLVDYREGSKAYRTCGFKNSTDQNTTPYEPNNIIGYGFENDKFFLSKEILIKDQPSKVVFVEVIVRGLVSLYKFEDTYFIEKNNSGLQELINETKEVIVDGRTLSKNTNQYIGTLNMLLFDCAELKERVQLIKLHEKKLTNLIEDYNRCKGESSISFKAKKPWSKAILGLTGGVNISQLSFDPYAGYEHLAGDYEISKSAIIGISLNVLSPRLSERISFHSNLFYLSSTYYNYNLIDNGSSIARNYVTIELQQIKIPLGIGYTFPKRNFTPFLNIGLSSTLHLNSSSEWIQEVESNNVVYTYNTDALGIKGSQFGIWGGFGIIKSITSKLNALVEFRYEQTDGFAQYLAVPQATFQSKITNFQVLIGIRTK